MIKRFAASAVACCLGLVGGVIVLGRPDPSLAAAFFSGAAPTMASAEAVVDMVCWLVLGGVLLAVLASTALEFNRRPARRRLTYRPLLYGTLGVLLFALGLARHLLPVDALCCGSSRAYLEEALRLVR